MCVLSIKVPIRKKSGNLFNDSRRQLIIVCCLAGYWVSCLVLCPAECNAEYIFLGYYMASSNYSYLTTTMARRRNVAMAWIDGKKAFDIALKSLIWKGHTFHLDSHGKFESGVYRRTNLSSDNSLKCLIPMIVTLSIHTCYNKDFTCLYTSEVHGWVQIYKITSQYKPL